MLLQSLHRSDVLPLVTLDTVNGDLGVCKTFRLSRLCGLGLGGFLLCIPLGALLGINGECVEVGGYRVCAVEAGVEVRVVL